MSQPDDSDRLAGFGQLLTTWGWWDCPRSGVTLIDCRPHRFICNFDEALDDYPDVYRLWPISDQELDAELAFWRLWVEWRGQFDSGARPDPFEQHPDYASLKPGIDQYRDDPSADALVAVPTWPARSQPQVRWQSAPTLRVLDGYRTQLDREQFGRDLVSQRPPPRRV